MATIAIGDVHGNCEALDDLLARIVPELGAEDTVVFLGDYIDRGTDTKGCVERILQLRRDCPARVITLLGNHEDWMLRSFEDRYRHSWLLGMAGLTTVLSYSVEAAEIISRAAKDAGPRLVLDRVPLPYEAFVDVLPPDHLAFFRGLTLVHQADGAVFSHGGLDPTITELASQTRNALIWGSTTWPEGCLGPHCHVYGHHDDADVDESGWPRPTRGPFTLGIDTISHGVLTAVRMPDQTVFQSKRFGERTA